MRPSWSIASRLTRWYALTIGLLVVSVTAISTWFVSESIARELDALVLEELDEMGAAFPITGRTRDDFTAIAHDLNREHPENPFAWRVWSAETGELWQEVGNKWLVDQMPDSPEALGRTSAPTAGLRYRLERIEPDLVMGLMVDGSWQVALLRRMFLLFGLVTIVFASLAIALGSWFGRRLAGHLRSVASQVRAVQAPSVDANLQVEGAPEEIRQVADALSEMLRNIRRESDRARLMTAGLAHELRSPIQNLIGEASVALLRGRSDPEYRKVIESQVEELRDLARVVDNLVALCSPLAAETPVALERFDLGEEAQMRLHKDRAQAARTGVELELAVEGNLSVDGDREALLLALHNLVSNAIKWSPRGGSVRVVLRGERERIEVLVDDSGPGIPTAERERIFEPFYRGPSADKGRIGYGLGLALTRTAVRAHGGRIEVETSPSGGSRFRIEIPRGGPTPTGPLRGAA